MPYRSAMSRLVVVIPLVVVLMAVSPAGADPLQPGSTIAFFGIHFLDTSTEGDYHGQREDEQRRIAIIRQYVIDQFMARGFTFADLAPVAEEMDLFANLADCNGCDISMAGRIGADYSMVGLVQKTSNLILAIRLLVRDAATGAPVRGLSVDIRGNTDESWTRGIRYILRNNIFRD